MWRRNSCYVRHASKLGEAWTKKAYHWPLDLNFSIFFMNNAFKRNRYNSKTLVIWTTCDTFTKKLITHCKKYIGMFCFQYASYTYKFVDVNRTPLTSIPNRIARLILDSQVDKAIWSDPRSHLAAVFVLATGDCGSLWGDNNQAVNAGRHRCHKWSRSVVSDIVNREPHLWVMTICRIWIS